MIIESPEILNMQKKNSKFKFQKIENNHQTERNQEEEVQEESESSEEENCDPSLHVSKNVNKL